MMKMQIFKKDIRPDKLFIISCLLIIFLFSFTRINGQTVIPDSLLYQPWDESMIEPPNQPWTEGCDSITHGFYPGVTFYYNVDTFCYRIATCELSEIAEEVWYFYFIVDLLEKTKVQSTLRKRMEQAAKKYKSKALEKELDVLDTYCYFLPGRTQMKDSDYFWTLLDKYERKGDLQTKLRIMQRRLFGCSGFPVIYVSSEMEKEEFPIVRLINEILTTLDRLDGVPYVIEPGYFYYHIGLIYYDFKYYNKAIPLLSKAIVQPQGHYSNRSIMRARDYLGDYYRMTGNYDLSDSIYLSILKSPDKVIDRPIYNTVAIGGLAANARLRGQREEAIRLYTIALSQALQVRDSTLAGGYALHLGRFSLEEGAFDKTRAYINSARLYLITGNLPIRNWESFYTLNFDYCLQTNQIAQAAVYMDSIKLIRSEEEHLYNIQGLAYAEQEASELERALRKEQLRKQRMQIFMISVILVLCILLSGVLFFFYRKLQQKNRNLFAKIKKQDAMVARYEALWSENNATVKPVPASTFNDMPPAITSEPNEFPENERLHELFIRLRKYLLTDRNFIHAETDTLVNELSTNRTYLFEAIKSSTGKTLQEYINDLRLEEAKRLLETTNEKIGHIAEICGYNSVRTFYRLFHSAYSISPASYRKIYREDKIEIV